TLALFSEPRNVQLAHITLILKRESDHGAVLPVNKYLKRHGAVAGQSRRNRYVDLIEAYGSGPQAGERNLGRDPSNRYRDCADGIGQESERSGGAESEGWADLSESRAVDDQGLTGRCGR